MRGGLLLLFVCALALAPARAAGQEPDRLVQAREAYESGARAYDEGRFGEAAEQLARADELVPNEVALGLAFHAALKGDDAIAGMKLVERAEGRGATVAELAARARKQFASRVGQLRVTCPPAIACSASLDGTALSTGELHWTLAGDHQLELVVEGTTERRDVRIEPGARVEVTPMRPAPPPPARPTTRRELPRPVSKPLPVEEEDERISPAWFWIGVGATALGGTGIIASGVDAVNKREAFLAGPSEETEGAGRSAQLRTNILIGVTSALAIATVTLGVFAFRPTTTRARSSIGVLRY